jgi:hypothetical protein
VAAENNRANRHPPPRALAAKKSALDGRQLQSSGSNCIVDRETLFCSRGNEMAEADLDVVIRQLAKQQHKMLMAAVKGRRDRYINLAAKAKDKQTRERYKQIAKNAMLQGAAAAKRLQISADNAADSYARSMRHAAVAQAAKRPVKRPKA